MKLKTGYFVYYKEIIYLIKKIEEATFP